MLSQHLDKKNLHHDYLLEGEKSLIFQGILKFLKEIKIATVNNPDFFHITVDNFKIDDAFNLKAMSVEKNITFAKKIFVVSANNFLLEAQNTLLKMLEEPTEDTHFFFIVPDVNILLPTFVSRFYLIKSDKAREDKSKEANEFIFMSESERINFIKELLAEPEDVPTESRGSTTAQAVGKDISIESARSKSLKFLNSLESALHSNLQKKKFDSSCFEQIFKVREYLRQPGSSTKSLMESVALSVPIF